MHLYFLQEFSDLHGEALQVVANCMNDREAVQKIHEDGGLARLMDFVLIPNNPEIQSTAIKCLTRVAQSCKHTYKKVEHKKLLYHCTAITVFFCCFLFFYADGYECAFSGKPQSSP